MPQLEPAMENAHVILITQQGVGVPGPASGFSWTKVPAGKAKAGGEKILTDKLVWTASGCTAPGGTCSGGGQMMETAEKVTCDGKGVMRKTDFGICNGTAQLPLGATTPSTCRVEIQDAGQTKVRAT